MGYRVNNVVYHADLALKSGTLQVRFVVMFSLTQFLVVNNVLAMHNTRRHDILKDILVEKGAMSFLALEMTLAESERWSQPKGLEEALRLADTAGELVQLVSRTDNWDSVTPLKTVKLAVDTCSVGALRSLGKYHGGVFRRGVVSQMLQSKELVLHKEIFEWAVAPAYHQSVKLYISETMSEAVDAGDVDTVRSILSAPYATDLVYDSASLLTDACRLGHTAIVNLLLEHGFKAEKRPPYPSVPLIAAARCGHGSIVQTLLLHGASVGQRDANSRSALGEACRYGEEAVVRILLEHGAEFNFSAGQHSAPLIAALENGHVSVVQLLLATKTKHVSMFGTGDNDYVLDDRL